MQLLSQIAITRIFGARWDLDIFLAAVAIPTTLVTVIYSTLNDGFLPLYAEKKAIDPLNAEKYLYAHLGSLTILSTFVIIIFGFFSREFSSLLYSQRGEAFVAETASAMYYLMFTVPPAIIATILGSYYYAHKDFVRFPLSQAVGSIGSLGVILLLGKSWGITALIISSFITILVQIIILSPHHLRRFIPSRVNLLPLLYLWIPLVVGNMATRSDAVLTRALGASLPTGYFVYLNLVSKIFSLAAGVMTIGIQVLLLPHLVEYFAQKKFDKMKSAVTQAKLTGIVISILVAVAITFIGPFAIQLLFVGGKFTTDDARKVTELLPFFVLPAVGWGINSIFFQPLVAIRKVIPLSIIQVVGLGAGWTSGVLVKNSFGAVTGISVGLIVLLFTGIIGSEIVWQKEKNKLHS